MKGVLSRVSAGSQSGFSRRLDSYKADDDEEDDEDESPAKINPNKVVQMIFKFIVFYLVTIQTSLPAITEPITKIRHSKTKHV